MDDRHTGLQPWDRAAVEPIRGVEREIA